MENEQRKIKKTLFGNYRAADVEGLLDAAEKLLQQKEEERAKADAEMKARLEEAGKLAAELQDLQYEAERLREENGRLEERNRRLDEERRTQEEREHGLRGEMDRLSVRLGEIRTELDLANSQNTILSNRVARQRQELEEKDQLLLTDPVGEANRRAEQIVQNAMNLSRQMIDDAENMRSRALASVRAAYFNTMDFRQTMEQRFFNLQNELNQSLLTLRAIEAEDDCKDHDYIQEKM
jgi:hypothetical protein